MGRARVGVGPPAVAAGLEPALLLCPLHALRRGRAVVGGLVDAAASVEELAAAALVRLELVPHAPRCLLVRAEEGAVALVGPPRDVAVPAVEIRQPLAHAPRARRLLLGRSGSR